MDLLEPLGLPLVALMTQHEVRSVVTVKACDKRYATQHTPHEIADLLQVVAEREEVWIGPVTGPGRTYRSLGAETL